MSTQNIPFNKPYLSGSELKYIAHAFEMGKISGNGKYTALCHEFFQKRYGFSKCLLTHSCTAALEMAAILLDIKAGDEVIIPSFTFVSTANAFALRGATIVFADSKQNHPGIDEDRIESLITEKTKAIVVVHYAGNACHMDKIMAIAAKHNLYVVEDAAQAIDSFYTVENGVAKPLGSIGHLAAFSFHETKNIVSGEGGMLVVNLPELEARAEVIWENGTNRNAFFRGEVEKYEWVDVGSSFLPSEVSAAILYAQLEHLERIQKRRLEIWMRYAEGLKNIAASGKIQLPEIPKHATNNAHIFYIICSNKAQRKQLMDFLAERHINAVFHYQSLHKSKFYTAQHQSANLPFSDKYSNTLLRLPFYFELEQAQQQHIIDAVNHFFGN